MLNIINPTFANSNLYIGAGIYDITTSVVGQNFMGYVKETQNSEGIHTRLRSRAFVIYSKTSQKKMAYVSADLALIFGSIKYGVVKRLRKIMQTDEFSVANIMISATHTHASASGLSHNNMFNIVFGFSQKDLDIVIEGIAQSIILANNNLEQGSISYNKGSLLNTNMNRSKEAYYLNHDHLKNLEVDKMMQQLNFKNDQGKDIGIINWFPVHGTSMSNNNNLISGDNKGMASQLFERKMGSKYDGQKTFVAAFANSNEGDVSPLPNNWFEADPKLNDFELTKIVGTKQYKKALELLKTQGEDLGTEFSYAYEYVKLAGYQITNGKKVCDPAIGFSLFAGAEDGPTPNKGFYEGMKQNDKFELNVKEDAIVYVVQHHLAHKSNIDYDTCHAPKAVLAALGEKESPGWAPQSLPFQIFKIGSTIILGVPGEMTTVAGRRLIKTVKNQFSTYSQLNVIIAGLSNEYSGYVTTYEEYQLQHFEGAATYFGPNTLKAYQQIFTKLSKKLIKNLANNNHKNDHIDYALPDPSLNITAIIKPSINKTYFNSDSMGKVIKDVEDFYPKGTDLSFTYSAPNPNINLFTQKSYFEVQKIIRNTDYWTTVAYDWDFETTFTWNGCIPVIEMYSSTCGTGKITWEIPNNIDSGFYRILYRGTWLTKDDKIKSFEKYSTDFMVY